ncbi:hypothetical protein SKAU_G00382290 [Synaphobranchus kaupii]|uniref:Uncharacterized protein n=1 Tax=Synaphobranchus kaupii TaxID=118154 RepID=A0A9Q1EDZ1_SYNKA|nr:hypothetical protein SKAU_G00382290 [Synaphobranchus kaupii]
MQVPCSKRSDSAGRPCLRDSHSDKTRWLISPSRRRVAPWDRGWRREPRCGRGRASRATPRGRQAQAGLQRNPKQKKAAVLRRQRGREM